MLRLCKELDLSDAASAELNVVSVDRDLASTPVRCSLSLNRMDILYCGEIQMLAPDVRAQVSKENFTGNQIAGYGASLDHRSAFPVLSHVLVIFGSGVDRDSQRCGRRVGSQPKISPEYVTVGCALIENAHQVAGRTDKNLTQTHRIVGHDLLLIVKND